MEITGIFGKKEKGRSRVGWLVDFECTAGKPGYGASVPEHYDEPKMEAIQTLGTNSEPECYATSPFEAACICFPAWDLLNDSFDYRDEAVQDKSLVKLYSARSPAWDLCGD